MSEDKCPVDHSTREAWIKKTQAAAGSGDASVIPANHPASTGSAETCPVDHNSRAAWLKKAAAGSVPEAIEVSNETCSSDKLSDSVGPGNSNITSPTSLSQEREISTIPRTNGDSNWVYPSQKQFFEAMKRKNWNPEEQDMETVVPIHNAVNERAWLHILMWERSNTLDAMAKCGGIKLTSFKGDLKKLTPRAWFNSTFLGYEKPFDRHDWTVDRCGVEVPYVIDFYGGSGPGVSFYLDVRPKINTWEGFKLRIGRAIGWA